MKKKFFKEPNMLAIDRPNFKLSIETDSIVVDEKNRTVVATVKWRLASPEPFTNINYCFWSAHSAPNGTAKGVALCSPEDVFDAEIGKKIAVAIAESNAYSNARDIVSGRFRRLLEMLRKLMPIATDFVNKADGVIEHNSKYIHGLTE